MPPRLNASAHASVRDADACRASLQGGSKTFFLASLTLPAAVREPAGALYAFCRMADDAIDHAPRGAAPLGELHDRLDLLYAGTPADRAADRAFADCVLRHGIPKEYPLALLEGFSWDACGRRYEDLAALRAYAVRVAGTVGAMMTLVMDVRERQLIARACDLGIAMQFTNIARDVGEDARHGRLYLPLQWMRQEGLDPDRWLEDPVFSLPLARVVRRLLAEADLLYRRSDAGLAQLPATCRPAMHAARHLYAAIGAEVARHGYDSVSRRAVVPWHRKARILAHAVTCALWPASPVSYTEFPEGRFLAEACLPSAAGVRDVRGGPGRFDERVAWVVDLFERLERRDLNAVRAAYETATTAAPNAS